MANTSSRLTAETIYEELRDRICLLDLAPGAMLREQSLAEEFGVSRTPIREALTMLRLDGLVVRRAGGGTTVSTVDLKHLRDVYSLRIKLSGLIGDFMKRRIPPEVTEQLHQLRVEVVAAADSHDSRRLGRLYNGLHRTILEVIDNEALKAVTDRLFRQTSRVWIQLLPEMNWDEEVQLLLDEIDESLEALSGNSAAHMAEIRSKYMIMLLTRFNEYLTRPLI